MKKCMGCMRDYSDSETQCPVCGYGESQKQQDMRNMPDALHPETILAGRFIIGRTLSYGNYAVSYIAWDALLRRRVVIREYFPLNSGLRDTVTGAIVFNSANAEMVFQEGRSLFEKEANRLNQNQDIRGIVSVYRCFRENNTSYQMAEYLEGETMADFQAEHPESGNELLTYIMPKVVDTVQNLHERGILHGSLNPEHIYLTGAGPLTGKAEEDIQRMQVRLIGFANARIRFWQENPYRKKTAKQDRFSAPELLAGEILTKRADLYSIGAVTCWLLTGKTPDGRKRGRKRKLPPETQDYGRIIHFLTAPDPDERPEDLGQLRRFCSETEQRRFFAGGQK